MNCGDQVFWDRIADMPWVEAEQECVLRREGLALQVAVVTAARANFDRRSEEHKRLGVDLFDLYSQLSLLNERIKYLRKVMERVRWVDACKAVLDEDTYMQVKVHMEVAQARVRAECPPPRLPTVWSAKA